MPAHPLFPFEVSYFKALVKSSNKKLQTYPSLAVINTHNDMVGPSSPLGDKSRSARFLDERPRASPRAQEPKVPHHGCVFLFMYISHWTETPPAERHYHAQRDATTHIHMPRCTLACPNKLNNHAATFRSALQPAETHRSYPDENHAAK